MLCDMHSPQAWRTGAPVAAVPRAFVEISGAPCYANRCPGKYGTGEWVGWKSVGGVKGNLRRHRWMVSRRINIASLRVNEEKMAMGCAERESETPRAPSAKARYLIETAD